jgi:hypothetical protein
MKRTGTSLTGTFGQATVFYGTEVVELSDEGTASDSLAFEPDFPHTISYTDYGETVEFDAGYFQTVEHATALRRATSLTWSGFDETDKDTLEAFLLAHRDNDSPFNWQPNGFDSSYTWKVIGGPSVQHMGAQIYTITCNLEESL